MCYFKIDKACKEIFAIFPRFLEDLLQSEDLARDAATRKKTVLASAYPSVLIPLFLGIFFQDIWHILSLAN